jgi:Arc/MetJ-type ribon-helix-helix transcriptional regulator
VGAALDHLQCRTPRTVKVVVEEREGERVHSENQVVGPSAMCQLLQMEITVTKPIEDFIKDQLAKGYANESEVARQAFLRWMAEEEFDAEPPRLREKLEAARRSKFRPYDPSSYDARFGIRDIRS